ncbi:MAG: sulfite exporter TauE/SafE family protein [Lentisphaeria bacterium]|nr:sulfite exporter TauE/SafE family protein [Lentisphaeria bacterium]
MEIQTIALVLVILAGATLIRSLTGFGNALLAMPLLALVTPMRVAIPLVAITAAFMGLVMLAQNRHDICLRSTWRLLLASLVGTPLGVWFLKGVHEQTIQFVLAILILGFSIHSLVHPKPHRLKTDRGAFVAGFVAGILGVAYNTNGPPIVMYGTMRGWSPERFKGTLQAFFVVSGIFILCGHAAAGLWTREVWLLSLLSLPVLTAALWLGTLLAKRIPKERFRHLVHAVLIGAALTLAAKSLHPGTAPPKSMPLTTQQPHLD